MANKWLRWPRRPNWLISAQVLGIFSLCLEPLLPKLTFYGRVQLFSGFCCPCFWWGLAAVAEHYSIFSSWSPELILLLSLSLAHFLTESILPFPHQEPLRYLSGSPASMYILKGSVPRNHMFARMVSDVFKSRWMLGNLTNPNKILHPSACPPPHISRDQAQCKNMRKMLAGKMERKYQNRQVFYSCRWVRGLVGENYQSSGK